ncbi:hypothetical protein [Microcystis aeruginosa]|uniref:Lipoprotein n=1 Tax=Microcystis aeruginosa PCC 9701 TaxID=721123 RepID=I4IQX6_MICAE|nr:hypothetical protein [Microcystis aeruginosa]CCI36700.1 conserved hypothetical protein [Microcystis aeruginosa PCC 9701]
MSKSKSEINLEIIGVFYKRVIYRTVTLTFPIFLASLVACNSSPEVNKVNPPPTASPSSEAPTSPNTQTTTSNVSIPGVQNYTEIIFKKPQKNSSNGFFEAVNDSPELERELPKTSPFRVSGWAVNADFTQPADLVIITMGDDNTPIAIAPLTIDRPDITKGFKKNALAKSGWSATIDPISLPNNSVVLRAWSYDTTTKKAIQLSQEHKLTWK